MSSRLRICLAALLLTVACDKGGKTETPGAGSDGAGAGEGGGTAADGHTLRYDSKALKLKQVASIKSTNSGGGQYAEIDMDIKASVELSEHSDKIKLTYQIDSVDRLELKGAFAPKKDGDDPKKFVTERGKGALLLDRLGEVDNDASDALPENKALRDEMEKLEKEIEEQRKAGKDVSVGAGTQVMPFLAGLLQLPDLPKEALQVGKPITIEAEEEQELGAMGIVVPMESESTYTLVKIDDSGSAPIAEVLFEQEESGAAEVQGNMITIDSSSEGTLLFNLQDNVPVSYEITNSNAFGFGQMNGESTTIIKATWEPAG